MGVLGRGGWARLRRSSVRGRRGRRGRPCAGTEKTPKRRGRERAKYTCDANAKWETMHVSDKGEECGGDCNNRTPLKVKKGINGLG
eukprot:4011344-Pleurochrysis_carterae.AAC.1